MNPAYLADITLVIHFSFILFVVFGGCFTLIKPRFAWIHLSAVVWGIWVNLMGWICPLTPLENEYRKAAGESGYDSSFLQHYISPLIYPDVGGDNAGLYLGIALLLWNLMIYTIVIYIRKRK